MRVKPRQTVPRVELPLVGGGSIVLGAPRPEKMTLVVFYRGLHCRRCNPYLNKVQALLPEFEKIGVHVVAASADSHECARQSADAWGIDKLDIAYDLPIETARQYGLFITRGVREDEPELCIEPATFFIAPDGTLIACVINSLTRLRPAPEDVLETAAHMLETGGDPKGEA
ncbi:MAG: hypothetical protein RLZ98_307 [Pseudomonadota bacterium]|jgi:peroxiredoxin